MQHRRFPRELAIVAIPIAIAVVVAGFSPSSAWVAGSYTPGPYAHLQAAMTSFSNRFPFALGDLFTIAVTGGTIAMWIVALRRRNQAVRMVLLRLAGRTVAVASILYLWFTLAWGWNYLRDPLYKSLAYDPASVRTLSIDRLEDAMVAGLNAAAPPAHRAHDGERGGEGIETTLRASFSATLPDIAMPYDPVKTIPKRWLLDPYFTATGISGMFFPYTFETFIASDVFWFELPFDLAHEWGHLAGIGRESDANLVGALTTLRDRDPILHYSALLMIYSAMPRIRTHDDRLSKLVLADYGLLRTREIRHVKPLAFRFAWGTYDRYLKAQHVESGVTNYTEYVQLLLGTATGRKNLFAALGIDERAVRRRPGDK